MYAVISTTGDCTSNHRLQCQNCTTEPPVHIKTYSVHYLIVLYTCSAVVVLSTLSYKPSLVPPSFCECNIFWKEIFAQSLWGILLYLLIYFTWTLTKHLEKKLEGNYTRMLWAILNKSWKQHPTKQQLYGHLPPITKTIQVRRTRRAGQCWRHKDKLISDMLLWTLSHGQAKAGRPARTYIQQLWANMGCSPEDLPEVMNDREGWQEKVGDIHADDATWWWLI